MLDTDFPQANDSPGLLLWRVTNLWQARQRAALKPFGLTHVQFVLLASLTWMTNDGPVTQRDLAEHARTDAMMTSQVLRALESLGLITRERHPTDARARALATTEAGASLANRAVRAVEAVDREFFDRLGSSAPDFASMLAELDRGRSASPPAENEHTR